MWGRTATLERVKGAVCSESLSWPVLVKEVRSWQDVGGKEQIKVSNELFLFRCVDPESGTG